MYRINRRQMEMLFRKITEERELYLPVKAGGQVNFAAWTGDAEVSLDTLKTVKSPKDAFFRSLKASIPAGHRKES